MMDYEKSFLVILVTTIGFKGSSCSHHYRVGESMWTIPLTQDFYSKWSSNQVFRAGDSLVFYFQSGFHDVMQVTRRAYEDCEAENPFRAFQESPATVPLHEEGVYYFICSSGNYCLLGQKLLVIVQHSSFLVPSPPVPISRSRSPPLEQPAFSPGPCVDTGDMQPTTTSSPSPSHLFHPMPVSHVPPPHTSMGSSQSQIVDQISVSYASASFSCAGLSMVTIFMLRMLLQS